MFGLAPVKTEGGAISYDSAEQAFIDRYTHVTYGLGFIIWLAWLGIVMLRKSPVSVT